MSYMDVNDGYAYINTAIENCMNKYAPKKVVQIRCDEKFHEPWLTVRLMKYNEKSRRLCRRAKISGLDKDLKMYRDYRQILNHLKLHVKHTHYQELFTEIGKKLPVVVECSEWPD